MKKIRLAILITVALGFSSTIFAWNGVLSGDYYATVSFTQNPSNNAGPFLHIELGPFATKHDCYNAVSGVITNYTGSNSVWALLGWAGCSDPVFVFTPSHPLTGQSAVDFVNQISGEVEALRERYRIDEYERELCAIASEFEATCIR